MPAIVTVEVTHPEHAIHSLTAQATPAELSAAASALTGLTAYVSDSAGDDDTAELGKPGLP